MCTFSLFYIHIHIHEVDLNYEDVFEYQNASKYEDALKYDNLKFEDNLKYEDNLRYNKPNQIYETKMNLNTAVSPVSARSDLS